MRRKSQFKIEMPYESKRLIARYNQQQGQLNSDINGAGKKRLADNFMNFAIKQTLKWSPIFIGDIIILVGLSNNL